MNNTIGRFFLVSALVVAVACDSNEADEPKTAAAAIADNPKSVEAAPAAKASPATAPAKPEPEPKAPAVEVSDAMKTFMSALGEHDKVSAALKAHGADGLEANMGQYNIKEPVVVSSSPGKASGETCYQMHAKTGAVRRKFEVCWTGDKITLADNKGLAL